MLWKVLRTEPACSLVFWSLGQLEGRRAPSRTSSQHQLRRSDRGANIAVVHPPYTRAVRILMLTGQRVEEIARLHVDQWDAKERIIDWSKTILRRPEIPEWPLQPSPLGEGICTIIWLSALAESRTQGRSSGMA